jgi:hypothetical protein
MIYLKLVDGRHIVILEPGNLRELERGGNPAVSPDKEVMVAYTPDVEWLNEKLMECRAELNQSPELLDDLLKQSQKRPRVEERPYRPPTMEKFSN